MSAPETRKIHFTKKKLESLPLPVDQKQHYYHDDTARGLEVCVTKGGTRSYVFRRKVEGVTRRIWIAYVSDISIEQARIRASELGGKIAMGINIFDEGEAKKKELTLRDLFTQYIERHAKKTRKTWEVMEKEFDRNNGGLASKKVSSINQKMAEQLHVKLATEKGPYTANRTVQLLRAVYSQGKKWKLFDGENPFIGITLFPEKPRERFLSKDEASRLLSALEKDANDTLRDFIKLSLFTGVRKANMMAIRCDLINRIFTLLSCLQIM